MRINVLKKCTENEKKSFMFVHTNNEFHQKISMLPQGIYKFNVILVKIPSTFSSCLEKNARIQM